MVATELHEIELNQLAEQLGKTLKERSLVLALAESCTGGMMAQAVTSVAGSSAWFDRGFVTYSNAAKIEMLGVSEDTLTTYGAVSEETAREMAAGALKNSHADLAIAITGIAGPDGGNDEKPVGTVCFAWATLDGMVDSKTRHFSGDREQVRRQAVECAFKCMEITLDCPLSLFWSED